MPNTGKKRILVEVDGELRNLFSIEERKGGASAGDLIITFVPQGFHEDGFSGHLEKVEQERISVHVSPSSPGNTIVYHIKTAENYYNTASYIEFDEQRRFWPFFTGSRPRPFPNEKAKLKANDEQFTLVAYKSEANAIAYSLWLTPNDVAAVPGSAYQIRFIFSHFTLHVSYHLLNIFSMTDGFKSVSATSPRRVDGEPDDIPAATTVQALGDLEAIEVNRFNMARLSSRLFRSHLRMSEATQLDLSQRERDFIKISCCSATEISQERRENHPYSYLVTSPVDPNFDDQRTSAYVKYGDLS